MSTAEIWIVDQRKTFAAWINVNLETVQKQQYYVTNLEEDVSDGMVFQHLLFALTKEEIAKSPNDRIKTRVVYAERLSQVLKKFHEHQIDLTNISAEDILDRRTNIILGFVWRLILKFQISLAVSIKEEEEEKGPSTAANKHDAVMVQWINEKISEFGMHISNITTNLQDGKVLCYLIFSYNHESLDIHSLSDDDHSANLTMAFTSAYEHFSVPPILDPETISQRADDKCMLTYLALLKEWLPKGIALRQKRDDNDPEINNENQTVENNESPLSPNATEEDTLGDEHNSSSNDNYLPPELPVPQEQPSAHEDPIASTSTAAAITTPPTSSSESGLSLTTAARGKHCTWDTEDIWLTVIITPSEARDLIKCDFFTQSSDPFVVGSYHPKNATRIQQQRTEIIKASLHPHWEKQLVFEVNFKDRHESQIELQVLDYDKSSKDDPMGNLSLPLSAMMPNTLEEAEQSNFEFSTAGAWHQLHNVKKGEIFIKWDVLPMEKARERVDLANLHNNPNAAVISTSSNNHPVHRHTHWWKNLLLPPEERHIGKNAPLGFCFGYCDHNQRIFLDLSKGIGGASLVDEIGAKFSVTMLAVWQHFRVWVSRDGKTWMFWGKNKETPLKREIRLRRRHPQPVRYICYDFGQHSWTMGNAGSAVYSLYACGYGNLKEIVLTSQSKE